VARVSSMESETDKTHVARAKSKNFAFWPFFYRRVIFTQPSGYRGDGTPMIRRLTSGEYRLYSRKKDPKTGKRRNLGTCKTRQPSNMNARYTISSAPVSR
jgi:hypothetical protein